ncbi:MAG: hypothetical protein KTR31_08700 [Myxococcales bacterium]|nr:hypothetical protein [Myxococcales bacterium]
MVWMALIGASAWADDDAQLDVARGWYLWRTGQDERAVSLARELADTNPDHLGAQQLHIAMEVVQGNGASMEAAYRDAWGMAPSDPETRVALAFALVLRNDSAGSWCEEVATLVASVTDGEPHYWATVAERLKDERCTGQTDHADAELRRIAKEGGVGWADGVFAKINAGYLKQDLPEDLERLWAEAPHRLDESVALWADHVAGPARARSRNLTMRALDDAAEGSDAMLVHAALQAFRQLDKGSKADKAAERLSRLDPDAKLDLGRQVADVQDPPIYDTIDACSTELTAERILSCLDAIDVPDDGSVAAHLQARRREAFVAASDPESAQQAARLAWLADPANRYNARQFARMTLALDAPSPEDLTEVVEAAQTVVDRHGVVDAEALDERQRRWVARDLQLKSKVLLAAGRAEEALDGQLQALQLHPTPTRRLVFGQLLAEAERDDDAVLQLVVALAAETEDTAGIRVGRELLTELNAGWHPEGMPGMLREVARAPEDRVPAHPLVGRRVPDLDAFTPDPPSDDEAEEAEAPLAVVVATWAPFEPGSEAALERLNGIARRYASRGVAVLAVDVGLAPSDDDDDEETPAPPSEGEAEPVEPSLLQHRFGGASVMRELRAVALPTVAVIDTRRGRFRSVLAPYHPSTLTLEEALDELLPEEEASEEED